MYCVKHNLLCLGCDLDQLVEKKREREREACCVLGFHFTSETEKGERGGLGGEEERDGCV